MSADALKRVMTATGKTVIDISASTKVHTSTIERFLKGNRVHRSTLAALERWAAEQSAPVKATG
jgi:transcriptional regulator with XRE-family HTH domain